MKVELKATEDGRKSLTIGDMMKMEDDLRKITGVQKVETAGSGRTIIEIEADRIFAIISWLRKTYRNLIAVNVMRNKDVIILRSFAPLGLGFAMLGASPCGLVPPPSLDSHANLVNISTYSYQFVTTKFLIFWLVEEKIVL